MFPLRFATIGVVPELPCTVKVPVTFPDAAPVNQTEKLVLWPGPRLIGKVAPETPNCDLEKVTC